MIFGLIWFLIWQKNWRFFGIFIYIIGIILLFQSDFPDFFIYNNKDQIHFIAKDDEYHRYSLDNNDFISKKILIQNNIKSFNKIQNVPRGTSLFKKNNKIILLYKNQYDESIPSNKHNADFQIILYDKMIENAPCGTLSCEMNNKVKNAKICSTWNIVCISIEKINKNGAYSIFIKNNRLIIKTGLDYIGNRPWNFHYKNDQ